MKITKETIHFKKFLFSVQGEREKYKRKECVSRCVTSFGVPSVLLRQTFNTTNKWELYY